MVWRNAKGICERKTLFQMKKEVDQIEFKGTRLYLVNNLSFSFYIQTGDLTCDQYVSLPLSATVPHLRLLLTKRLTFLPRVPAELRAPRAPPDPHGRRVTCEPHNRFLFLSRIYPFRNFLQPVREKIPEFAVHVASKGRL